MATTTTRQKRMWTGASFGAAVAAQRKKAAQQKFMAMAAATRPRLPYQTAPAARGRVAGLQEVKSFDCQWLGGNMPLITAAAGAEPGAAFAGFTEINCIPQGATVANRIGNKVVIRSLHVKATIGNQVLATLAVARVAVIYDKQPNGAFPAVADIFLDQPAGLTNGYSSVNIANKSRFTMLRDQFFNLDAAQSQIHTINWYIKGRWEVEFGANAGNIGDFRTGAIYLFAIYVGAVVNLNAGSARVRYFD